MSINRWISLAAISVPLITVSLCNAQDQPSASPAGKQPAPHLVLSQKEWNFGQVWYGDPCQTEIELKNTGDATLKIIKVKSSCGCTVAQPKRSELGPGETDTMTVTYNTKKMAKKVSQVITIITNDASEPETRFPVIGEVWHVFDAEPNPRLAFGLVKSTSTKTISIELKSNMPEKVSPKLEPLPADSPFDVRLEELEPGTKFKLTAALKPPLAFGRYSVEAVVETGVERLPKMSISVSAIVPEPVSVRPDRLMLTPAQTAASSRRLWVYYDADRHVEITGVRSSDPNVQIEELPALLSPTGTSEFPARQFVVRLPPYAELPDEPATVEILTNDSDPKYQKLVVSIEKYGAAGSAAGKFTPKPGQKLTPILKPLPGQTPTTKPTER